MPTTGVKRIGSNPFQKIGKAYIHAQSYHFEHVEGDGFAAPLNIRDKAAVDAKIDRHIELRHVARSPEFAKTKAKS